MKEHPILFSGPLVRAILKGRKTQTRRLMKPQPWRVEWSGAEWWSPSKSVQPFVADESKDFIDYSPFKVGDRLWVRETWQAIERNLLAVYREDYRDDPHGYDGEKSPDGKYRTWKPSIHMPRWASRITLEVTGVSVERVQSITESDAKAEGFESIGGFASAWQSIYGESWQRNDWVWAYSFKVLEVRS